MKERLKLIFQGPLVIYPLLFAIFPILFLYAVNIREVAADQVVIPLVVSLLSTLMLWTILSLILRSIVKGGLATTIFLFLFFAYGRFYEFLENWAVFVPKHSILLPGLLLVWGYCVYFIMLARRDFRNTTRILNIVAVVLIAINLFNIGYYKIENLMAKPQSPAISENPALTTPEVGALKNMPDIYHIVLDGYASLSTIKEHYGYDNSEFASFLVDNGFFIAHDSRTHVVATEWSLASTLNMDYVSAGEQIDTVLEMISNNKVAAYLKSKGYKFVYISFLKSTGGADLYYNLYESDGSSDLVNEFMRVAWNSTMLRPFYTYIAGNQFENRYRAGTINSLDLLKELPGMPGPKFVFAHIDCPHNPFVFGPKGERVGAINFYNFADKQVYLGQYIFITGAIEKVVTELLKTSGAPPIIILQSDHGPKIVGEDAGKRILNAIFIPGVSKDCLYDSVSPVNTYRLIFNNYFNTNYKLLEDTK